MDSFGIGHPKRESDDISDFNISDIIADIEKAGTSYNIQTTLEDNYEINNIINQSTNVIQNNVQPRNASPQHQQMEIKPGSKQSRPYVRIIEQPSKKPRKFRYESEIKNRAAGTIPGANNKTDNKTFPTIEIVNYVGRAIVVVSCVTKDEPYRPHPHSLVGKERCKNGICTLEVNIENMQAVCNNFGIQRVTMKEVDAALRKREEMRVDPFRTGFSHRKNPTNIDLKSLRLCFQVYLEGDTKGRFTLPLKPVVSDPIYDTQGLFDLKIYKLSKCSSSVIGGKEIILLCEKVEQTNIAIRFFEEHDGKVIWEAYGDFKSSDIHKQVAISFRTPKYRSVDIEQSVQVYVQLKRPLDGETGDPISFEYLPLHSENFMIKRQKVGGEASNHIRRFLTQAEDNLQNQNQLGNNHQDLCNLGITTNKVQQNPLNISPLTGAMPISTTAYRTSQCTPSPQTLTPPTPVYNLVNTPFTYKGPSTANQTSPDLLEYNQASPFGGLSPNINISFSDLRASVHPSHLQQLANDPSVQKNNQLLMEQPQVWNLLHDTSAVTSGTTNMLTNQSTLTSNQLYHQQWNIPTSLTTNPFIMIETEGRTETHDLIQHQEQRQQMQQPNQLSTISDMSISDAINMSNSLLDIDQLINMNSDELSGLSIA